MATTAAPYGMRPVNRLGGTVNTGAFRQIKIASGYATAIFFGDVVKLVTAGTVEKDSGTATATPIGIFMGCTYTDPNLNYKLHNQQWPASTVASDAKAYVCDDPNMLFQIQGDDTIAQADLGANAPIVQTAGSTSIGNSKNALDAGSIATTATLPLKIVDFVDGPTSAIGDTYTDVIVKWNVGHQWTNTTGI